MERNARTRGFHYLNFSPAVLAITVTFLIAAAASPALCQTYTVLHNFTGAADGAAPMAGLTMDIAGNLYGTAQHGGNPACSNGCGSVFRLTHQGSSWLLSVLYNFKGGNDSAFPGARVVFGPDGALYGTTAGGTGNSCSNNGCGTVFRLRPPATFCGSVSCPWTETVLYRFAGQPDGAIPGGGDLVFDPAGNIYGTTVGGGTTNNYGTAYKLSHSGGGWTESILYNFTGQQEGGNPIGGLTFDTAGNLYGTTSIGGLVSPPDIPGAGVIFKLTPSGGGWTESTVYMFQGGSEADLPAASLTLGSDGFLYGTSLAGAAGFCQLGYHLGCGVVFSVPYSTIFGFFPNPANNPPLSGPMAALALDSGRNIYGTTTGDEVFSAGNVFKLSYPNYSYTSLYDFTGGRDGGHPVSNVVFDTSGNLYGTASGGGGSSNCQGGCGVIWKITP
jgi:uncharacterized repeat protein (TIGR03803 family)